MSSMVLNVLRGVPHGMLIHQTPVRTMFGRSFFDPSFRSLIRDVERTFDHLYQDMNRSLNPLHMAIPHVTSAAANDNGMYRLNIDMAGFRPEDIKLSVKGRVLTVQAKLDRKCDDGSRYFQEVAREYVLPESLQPDALKSILNDDGVLRIEAPIPLPEPEKPKEIPIAIDRCEIPKKETKNQVKSD